MRRRPVGVGIRINAHPPANRDPLGAGMERQSPGAVPAGNDFREWSDRGAAKFIRVIGHACDPYVFAVEAIGLM